MKRIPEGAPKARSERFASQILHDSADLRLVAFHLLPGQVVPPHRNSATVLIQVLEGEGLFRGDGAQLRLGPGMAVVYAPGETHSIDAVGGSLRFHAVIAPGPS